ncbi:MAG: efflux RND transporter periplasmic adaptor subunit [Xanthomonadales bacterium]|nr:efflux RND transporter periplasmic adaptor subunit [Xanthomonadales bacterium]
MKFPLAAMAAMLLVSLSGSLQAQSGGGRPALVRVAIAEQQSLAPVTQVPGTVASRSDARLSAEVEGRLVSVADVGTRVNEGDALARIEDTALRLRQQELKAEVSRAEARLRFLDSEVQRIARLAESNLAAANLLDLTRSDRDVARGDLDVARSRLAQISVQLSKTTMTAPFSGVVVERLMTPGERVSEGRDVVRLVDQEHLEVIARAPLENYAYVNEGLELEVRAGDQVATGVVRTVVAVGDENTHLFEMRLDLEGSPFPVGKTLRVSVPTAEVKQVLAVPRDALVLRPEGITVFVVDANDQAQQVNVTTGIGAGDKIEVFGAISAGDRVVIRGNERLRSGQPVSVVES